MSRRADNEDEETIIKGIFGCMKGLIEYLSSSEITAGYNGIRDFVIPIY